MKRYATLVLAIFLFVQTFGQTPASQYIFELISKDSGFTFSGIATIATDKHNMMWFGCDNGLYYYNNRSFKHYRHDPQDDKSIRSNEINLIYNDSSDRLWVLTDSGLCYYQPASDNFHNIDFDLIELFDSDIFIEYQPGNYLIAIEGKLYEFDINDTSTLKAIITGFSSEISTIYCNGEGVIYVGCQNGELYSTDNSLERFLLRYSEVDSPVSALCEHDGRIYIGYLNQGVNVVETDSGNTIRQLRISSKNDEDKLSSDKITAITKQANGDIWIGSGDGCVIISSESTTTIRANSYNNLPRNSIHSIHIDQHNAVWIGTWAGSIGYFNDANYTFRYNSGYGSLYRAPGTGMVSHFAPNDSLTTWVAGEWNGLSLHSAHNNRHIERYGSDLHIKTIEREPSSGDLWIGTIGQGLHLLNNRTKKITQIKIAPIFTNSSILSAIAIDQKSDTIWVGTRGQGLLAYNKKTQRSTTFYSSKTENFTANSIWDLAVVGDDLLICANDGFSIRNSQGLFTNYSFENPAISNDEAFSMCHAPQTNQVYIGTREHGVQIFDLEQKRFIEFEANKSLRKYIIYNILLDSRKGLWMSTNNGLYRYSILSKELKHFGKSDGLINMQFHPASCAISPDGVVYFGSISGFNYINIRQIRTNTTRPNAFISTIKINNEPLSEENCTFIDSQHIADLSEIVLSHDNNSISFQATSNNHLKSEDIRFKYRLKGYQDRWFTIDYDREITFTRLPSGSYTLEVMASNNDGLWGESRSIDIKISAPLYAQWYAIILYLIIASLIVVYIIKQALFKIKARKDVEIERQINIINSKSFDEKVKFFMNISHELRTPLSLIKAPLGVLEKELEHHNSLIHVGAIKRNTEQLLKLTNQILDFRLLEVGRLQPTVAKFDIIKLCHETFNLFEYHIKDREINFTFACSAESIMISADCDMISKIIYNLLTNALKYSDEKASITITIETRELKDEQRHYDLLKGTTFEGQAVIISVEDDGQGIHKDRIEHIFERFYYNANKAFSSSGIGLHMCMEYANLHGGNISVTSQLNKGSKFTVSLPTNTPTTERSAEMTISTLYKADEASSDAKRIDQTRDQHKPKVLIIDDNAEIRFYLKKILSKSYNCLTAKNGQVGYELAIDAHPAAIILDVLMPVMGGVECALRLKEDAATKHTPIIMLTGLTDDNNIIQGVKAGADAYISKPINEHLLFAHLEKLISKKLDVVNTIKRAKTTTIHGVVEKSLIQNVEEIIESNIHDNTLNVDTIASRLLVSRSTLHRNFKSELNIGVSEYIREYRLRAAIKLMNSGVCNIDELATCVGFSSSSYFCKAFKDKYGVTPKKYYDSLKVEK